MSRWVPRLMLGWLCWSLVLVQGWAADVESGKPHLVMLIAEQEYRTDESLPSFANQCLSDYRTTFVFADPDDSNRLQGIEAVDSADVLLVSVRRRTLPKDQLARIRRHVAAGKPVIGIRTASHAFALRQGMPAADREVWPEFDRQVFGGNYTNHYGNSLRVTFSVVENIPQEVSPLVKGIPSRETFSSSGSLYRVSPLAAGATVLMHGQVEGQAQEPVAWIYRREDGGKSFYTSLGHVDDFRGEVLPRLLVNAIEWSLQ